MAAARRCGHRRGDFVHGLWVCGDCFSVLEARPVRYGIAKDFRHEDAVVRGPQQIVWQAGIATDTSGVRFGTFLLWMISHVRAKSGWNLSKEEARGECLDCLKSMDEPFGADGSCWSRDDAKYLVIEGICSYWDDDAACGANS